MQTTSLQDRLDQARQLLDRLERVSADSVWAHRSSGYRGSLLKWISWAENPSCLQHENTASLLENFDPLYAIGMEFLARAAREKLKKRGIDLR